MSSFPVPERSKGSGERQDNRNKVPDNPDPYRYPSYRSNRFLNEAAPTAAVLQLKSYEAFTKAADGKATKIIVPSNIQNLASLATALTETVKNPD